MSLWRIFVAGAPVCGGEPEGAPPAFLGAGDFARDGLAWRVGWFGGAPHGRHDGCSYLNPSDVIKTRDFAPLARALLAAHGARDWLGWTAVAQCPTLSAKKISVSPKISNGDLTNMAIRSSLPHSVRRARTLGNEFRRICASTSRLGHRI